MTDKNGETIPPANPDDPLRWNMKLPGTDQVMCWGQPRAKWGGKVRDLQQPHKNMAQQNLAELRLTQEWMTTLLGHLTAARDMMREKAVSLTPEDRATIGNIGLNNLGMIEAGVGLIKDNATWFPADFDREEILADMSDRTSWLQAQSPALEIAEMWADTFQAINSDLVKGTSDAKPYINQGAKLSGASDTRVATYNEYFKRYRTKKAATPAAKPQ